MTQRPFLLKYDKFGRDLVRRINEKFAGTLIEIPIIQEGIVPYIDIFRRAAVVTVLAENPELRKTNLLPITPVQSERFSQLGTLEKTVYGDGVEELGLIFCRGHRFEPGEVVWSYGLPSRKLNEVPTVPSDLDPLSRHLYESINKHKEEYGLTQKDLQDLRVLVVNPALEKNNETEHGAAFVILPGVTEIHRPEFLHRLRKEPDTYGIIHPSIRFSKYSKWYDPTGDAGLPFPAPDGEILGGDSSIGELGGVSVCASYEVKPKVGPGEFNPKTIINQDLRIIKKAHQGCPKINFNYPLGIQLKACQEEFGDVIELRMNYSDPHIMHLSKKGYMNLPPLSARLKHFGLQASRLVNKGLENMYYPAP